MSEPRKLWIEGPAGHLECMLRIAAPARALAVISHPHPLFGGTMHNPVIFHTDRELYRRGLSTLRFNFRGAGASDGLHDEGRGEIEDVGAAVSWLRGISPGLQLVCVGYSFGSWCSVRWARRDPNVAALVAIGLPADKYGLEEITELDRPLAVVQAENDEFGSPAKVHELLQRANPPGKLTVIPDAPHLFPGRAREVAAAVVSAVDGCLQTLGVS